MSDHRFDHDGISFRYRDEGAGVPFVWQHGLGSDLAVNFDLVPPPAGTRMIGLDARGHGETRPLGPVERLSIPQTVEDVATWLDYLGVERAVVGGISMGAAVALRFAQLYPQRVVGLILSRPAWLDEPNPSNLRVFTTIANLIRDHGAREGKTCFLETREYLDFLAEAPDAAQVLLGQFDHPRADETYEKYSRIVASCPSTDRSSWRSISVPTLILANNVDPLHPIEMAETLHTLIPESQLVEVTPKSVSIPGHTADVRAAIDAFFNRHLATFSTVL